MLLLMVVVVSVLLVMLLRLLCSVLFLEMSVTVSSCRRHPTPTVDATISEVDSHWRRPAGRQVAGEYELCLRVSVTWCPITLSPNDAEQRQDPITDLARSPITETAMQS